MIIEEVIKGLQTEWQQKDFEKGHAYDQFCTNRPTKKSEEKLNLDLHQMKKNWKKDCNSV